MYRRVRVAVRRLDSLMENSHTDQYTFHEVLGEGSCGRVYRCTTPDDESRAVKVLTAMAINRDLVRFSLRKLDELPPHPGIAKVHHYSLADTPYHYVMDLYADPVLGEKGEEAWQSRRIDNVIGKTGREEAWRLLDQIAEALAYMHGYDLFHGCLKPSNVFLVDEESETQIKITDPGQGWVSGAHYLELHDIPFYASPEQLRTAEFLDGRGKGWDVYSFGVLAFLLLNERLPRLSEMFASRKSAGKPWESFCAGVAAEPFDQPPHEYAELLEVHPEIMWQITAVDEAEAKRIEILNRCLALDPGERFADMLEVVDSFKREQLALEVEEFDEITIGWKERLIVKPVRKMGKMAAALTILFLASLVVIGVQHFELRRAEGRMAKKEEAAKVVVKGKDSEIQKAIGRLAEAEDKVARTEELERSVRSQLGTAHDFGNELFSVLQELGGVNSPGFREQRRRLLTRARDYYRIYLERNRENPNLVEETLVARSNLVAVLKEIGARDEMLLALREYAESIDKVLVEDPREAAWRSLRAEVQRDMARIYLEQHDLEKALEAVGGAAAVFEELAKEAVDGDDYLYELAETLSLTGEVQRVRKYPEKAIEALMRSVEVVMPLHERLPGVTRYRFRLASDFALLGDLMVATQDAEGAVSMHEKAVEMLGELVREDSQHDEYTHQLARSFLSLGEIQSSDKEARDALALLQRLSKKDASNESYRHSLARCYSLLSELQRDRGEAKNARELQETALDMLKALLKESPVVQEYRFDYAECLARLAGLAEDESRFKESLALLTEAVGVIEELTKKNTDNIQYQRTLAELRGNIGFANEKVGNKEKAKEVYASAVIQWERLASLLPEDDLVERGLLWSRRQLAALDQ